MISRVALLAGKVARFATRLRGGGSAFPGMVVERIDPGFLPRLLKDLPRGVVVISGTNGKTTTTKIVTALLESQGLRVFTNRTGSNFARGVISAALGELRGGKLVADVAVLELDEAHAVQFVRDVPPRHCLILNVLRDQMDRFGEIDNTARMLGEIVAATTDGCVLNREDARVSRLADRFDGTMLTYVGFDPELADQFPDDDALYGSLRSSASRPPADVTLTALEPPTFEFGGASRSVQLALTGVHNVFNAAAALALTRSVLRNAIDYPSLLAALAAVTPAFGRGEAITFDGERLELFLVKNPAGFRLSLKSALPGAGTMIAINDEYADGRDMSWLWDVDFTELGRVDVVTGTRASDMALRLAYDEREVGAIVEDLSDALDALEAASRGRPKQIFTTYTAMLELRRLLARRTAVEKVE